MTQHARKTIEIRSLSIGYSNRRRTKVVTDNITADIYNGELTCLLGSNGIGKSTLLRTLSAFQPKLNGKIWIEGKEIETYTDKQLSHVISVVLTDRIDVRNMTAEEVIGLGRSPYTSFWGALNKEDKETIKHAISLIKIDHLANRMIHTLSDGERQKVMIAKALVQETPIIFLDEPTAFLDFPSKVEIMQLLHQLSREMQKTIFLSTHDLELALQIADKLWIMNNTQEITIGTPEDLSLNGSLSKFFNRKGVTFDIVTGLFRVDTPFIHKVKLIGEGPYYTMACKALQRNGIMAQRNVESDFVIEITDPELGEYTIHSSNSGITSAKSIDAMLTTVRAHKW